MRPSERTPSPQITDLLIAWQDGDHAAMAELAEIVNDDLRRMARLFLKREHIPELLQPTVLVDEFFLKLLGSRKLSLQNRGHFFGYAAQAMQRFLVDHARRLRREKRGGGELPVSLSAEHEAQVAMPDFDILAVNEVIEKLEREDPRMAIVVKLRYFVGMTVDETAAALEISPSTVKRDWEFARRWLYKELQRQPRSSDPGDREQHP
jgi:RNA polymerase sigma factor (TIGR02999 family)